MNDHDEAQLFAHDDSGDEPMPEGAESPWYDPTEECDAHPGIECDGDGCPCRQDCCMNEEDDVE